MKNCAACNKKLKDGDYLECVRCVEVYHYPCLNFSSEEAVRIKNDTKFKWMCPNCRSKQPKGDNSNKLVGPSTPTGMADTFNVTRRKAQSKLDAEQTYNTATSDYVTRSDIQTVVRDELRSIMSEFTNDLKNTINVRFKETNDQLSGFQDSLSFLSEQFDSMKSDMEKQSSQIKQLKSENESLRSEVVALSGRVRQMDQMSRSTNLELQCVPEHKSENVIAIVRQLGSVVKCPINDCDISYCSRIAKSNPNTQRPRSILVKFNTPRTRDSVLAAVIQYNKDHPKEKLNTSALGLDDKKIAVFVSENLSLENKSLHAAARIRAKQLNYKYVWVRGGRVYVRKSDTTEAVFIRNMDVVNSLK